MQNRWAAFASGVSAIVGCLAWSFGALGDLRPAPNAFPPAFALSALDGINGMTVRGHSSGDVGTPGIAICGDVNVDGFDDLLVGSVSTDSNGLTNTGVAYVVFGARRGLARAVIDPRTMPSSKAFVINGVSIGGQTGASVGGGRDINADGIPDIFVGAPGAKFGGISKGAAYIIFGGPGVGASGTINASALDGSNGFTFRGVGTAEALGCSVACAGDINADGVQDILVGASGAQTGGLNTGAAYVMFGGAGVGAAGTVAASDLTGANGFTLQGFDLGSETGLSVGAGGDINHDGFDDALIGAHGSIYVVFGGPGVGASGVFELSSLDGENGFVITGIGGTETGAVSSGGDFNGDGFPDIVIGAPRFLFDGKLTGGVYVVFGGPGVGASGSVDLSSLTGSNGFVARGFDPGGRAGNSVAPAGDVNSDGHADILIGAPRARQKGTITGAAYVVYGGPGGGGSSVVPLQDLDGADGFAINGVGDADSTGTSVAGGGDIDGDDVGDMVIGAPGAGVAYVVYGRRSSSCFGDINGDGSVLANDFGILAMHYGAHVPPNMLGDLTGDGFVDAWDFNLFVTDFGCGP